MDQAPILLSRRVGFDVMVEINFAANLEERMVGILPILAESKEGTQAASSVREEGNWYASSLLHPEVA